MIYLVILGLVIIFAAVEFSSDTTAELGSSRRRDEIWRKLVLLCGSKLDIYEVLDHCPKNKNGSIDLKDLVEYIVDKRRELEDPHYLQSKRELDRYLDEKGRN